MKGVEDAKVADAFASYLCVTASDVLEGTHPIVPVMLGDAELASKFSTKLLEKGIYAPEKVGFLVTPQVSNKVL